MPGKGKDKKERTTRLRGTKVRIYPNKEQVRILACLFGAVRFVYNWGLELRRTTYTEHGKSLSCDDTVTQLPKLKRQTETSWLKTVPSQPLQQALRNLDRAFENFFKKRAKYPKFKNKKYKQSASFPQGVRIAGNQIYLPKIGWLKVKIHREIYGRIKTVTVSKTCTGKYYASILMDEGVFNPAPPSNIKTDKITGIDLGLTNVATTDTGFKQTNPRILNRATRNLRRKQKALSRKKKGSKNRARTRILFTRVHERVKNTRDDFQHKLTNQLIGENQVVIVETLKVVNMLKNRKLAKHISDVAWSEFLRKLQYKCEWRGIHFIAIDQWYASSKTCSECGCKMPKMPLDIRFWTCPACHVEHDRDVNAGKNIKQEGIRMLLAAGLSATASGDLHQTGEMPAVVDEGNSFPVERKAGSPVLQCGE